MNDVVLAIAGPDSGYRQVFQKNIARIGLARGVIFTCPLADEAKLQPCVDADVYCLPPPYEIFGTTVLEAMARGTPVIVTDQCGLADIVAKQGHVVPRDSNQLNIELLEILGRLDDERSRAEK